MTAAGRDWPISDAGEASVLRRLDPSKRARAFFKPAATFTQLAHCARSRAASGRASAGAWQRFLPASGVSFASLLLLALPGVAAAALLLRRYYSEHAVGANRSV
jgi:hypothetical protein